MGDRIIAQRFICCEKRQRPKGSKKLKFFQCCFCNGLIFLSVIRFHSIGLPKVLKSFNENSYQYFLNFSCKQNSGPSVIYFESSFTQFPSKESSKIEANNALQKYKLTTRLISDKQCHCFPSVIRIYYLNAKNDFPLGF